MHVGAVKDGLLLQKKKRLGTTDEQIKDKATNKEAHDKLALNEPWQCEENSTEAGNRPDTGIVKRKSRHRRNQCFDELSEAKGKTSLQLATGRSWDMGGVQTYFTLRGNRQGKGAGK